MSGAFEADVEGDIPGAAGPAEGFWRVPVITGGSTGTGAAAALRFANAGARVLVTGRNQATLTASAVRNPNIAYLVADIGKAADAIFVRVQ